jgi:outer membrane protein assembly factor BamB
MSLTHDAKTASTPHQASLLRRFRFPLIILAIFGCIFAIPWVCVALGVDTDSAIPVFMATQWHLPALGILLIGLWWVFFSPFRWSARLGIVAVVAIAIAGFCFCVREVELTKGRIGLVPRFHFVWEPSANERLAAYLKQQPAKDDTLSPVDANVGPDDFPRYRGAKLDGVVALASLETDWSKHPPRELWKHPSAGGYSGVAVAGNIAVTLEQRDGGEAVVCYDRASGQQRWAYGYGVYYKDPLLMGDGPRSTPTIHEGHIFTVGASGDLVCLDAQGKKQWSTNILTDAKAKNVKWGLSGSPLVVDDLVVAHAGIDDDAPANSALIAYERATGTIRWRTGNRKAGYSSPQLATLAGKSQIILFDGAGLISYDSKTGAELWQYPWITMYEMNSIQPVVLGDDRVFISSELPNGCALLRVKAPSGGSSAWTVETLWQNKNLAARYANPVTDGKSVFGLHNMQGVLTCLDAATGKVKWKGEREGPGQMLLAGRHLLVVNGDKGEVALFDTTTSGCTELARYPLFNDKTWNTPAVAGKQLFVRNQASIVCLELPQQQQVKTVGGDN